MGAIARVQRHELEVGQILDGEVDPEAGHGAGHVADRHMEEAQDTDVHEPGDARE